MKEHKKQRLWSITIMLALAAVALVPLMSLAPVLVSADGPNLVKNPDFGGGTWSPKNNSTMGNDWSPWWKSRASTDTGPYLFEPDYSRQCGDPYPRRDQGNCMQKVYTFSATHDAGFKQAITGLTPGTGYTFSIWAWGLAMNRNDPNPSSDAGAQIEKKIGVDPTGGQDPFSGNIVWSGSDWSKDTWTQMSLNFTASSSSVTIYTRSQPNLPVKWNAAFWANANLVATAPAVPTATPTPSVAPTVPVPPAAAEPQDERYFFQTGYRIGDDKIWDYFNKRGGLRTFGYPISRKFRLLGKDVQIFQRRVVQIDAAGNVGQLNLLDQDVMPYNTMNGATFPKFDAGMVATLPPPGGPGYDTAVTDFIKTRAPDSWNGMDVGFYKTFMDSIKMEDAFPDGNGSDGLLMGFDLEMWGVPTSAPAVDPSNFNFVYLRFQRGIMHYSKDSGLTQGLLIGDYFKSILTGQRLPPDLDQQSTGSRFYKQYLRGTTNSLARPGELPDSNLNDAFEAGPTR